MKKKINCLISAGPTREWLDSVRFFSNPSSGKMGYALADEAHKRGFQVTLVSGPVNLDINNEINLKRVETAEEMRREMVNYFKNASLIIMCAAVCDHRPKVQWRKKKKKEELPLKIEIEMTPDILKELGNKKKDSQKLVGFAAETENGEEYAKSKLITKNLDWIALNDVSKKSIGFGSDFNEITLFSSSGKKVNLTQASKKEIATQFFETILK